MNSSPIQISVVRIVLATIKLEEMARFYGAVFEMTMLPLQAHGATLYQCSSNGVTVLLCPNSIAGVTAEQSRHQMTFRVRNLAGIMRDVQALGCVVKTENEDDAGPQHILLTDPDGNSLELVRE